MDRRQFLATLIAPLLPVPDIHEPATPLTIQSIRDAMDKLVSMEFKPLLIQPTYLVISPQMLSRLLKSPELAETLERVHHIKFMVSEYMQEGEWVDIG